MPGSKADSLPVGDRGLADAMRRMADKPPARWLVYRAAVSANIAMRLARRKIELA